MNKFRCRTPAFLYLFSFCLLSTSGQAATEFTDGLVPIELVREIAGSGEIYASLPDGFPLPDLSYLDSIPLRLLGSRDSVFQQTVYLSTEENIDITGNALKDAYIGNGWLDVSAPINASNIGPPINTPQLGIRGITSGPFVSAGLGSPNLNFVQSLQPISLCHDQFGSLSIRGNYASVTQPSLVVDYQTTSVVRQISCQEQLAYNEAGLPGSLISYFQALLPTFDMPEGTTSSSTSFAGGRFFALNIFDIANGNFSEPMQADLESRITASISGLSELYAHYADQLMEQGWEVDSSANGFESSASVWVKTVIGPDFPGTTQNSIDVFNLQGVLTLLDSGDDNYYIWFRMLSR